MTCANTAFRKHRCFRKLIFALLCIISIPLSGQTEPGKPSISLGLQTFTGFIIPHTESIRSISHSNPHGINANIAWHYSNLKAQSYCNCFPRIGVSIMYVDFDNPGILGEGVVLAPFVEPFIPFGKKWNISIRFSTGVAYLNQVYHPVTNPDNLFYSTRFSYLLSLSPVLNYQLFNNWSINLSANYNHISNGGNTQPNKGINFPTAAIGFDYIFTPVDFTKSYNNQFVDLKKKHSFRIIFLGTGKTPSNENHRKFLYGLSGIYGRSISRLSMLTAGLEFVNDGALREELSHRYSNPPDHKRAAVLAGHDLQIGKFSFSQQLGIYLYDRAKARHPVYQRWGLDYHLSRNFLIGLNLKSHLHVADFLDIRIGYIL